MADKKVVFFHHFGRSVHTGNTNGDLRRILFEMWGSNPAVC